VVNETLFEGFNLQPDGDDRPLPVLSAGAPSGAGNWPPSGNVAVMPTPGVHLIAMPPMQRKKLI